MIVLIVVTAVVVTNNAVDVWKPQTRKPGLAPDVSQSALSFDDGRTCVAVRSRAGVPGVACVGSNRGLKACHGRPTQVAPFIEEIILCHGCVYVSMGRAR